MSPANESSRGCRRRLGGRQHVCDLGGRDRHTDTQTRCGGVLAGGAGGGGMRAAGVGRRASAALRSALSKRTAAKSRSCTPPPCCPSKERRYSGVTRTFLPMRSLLTAEGEVHRLSNAPGAPSRRASAYISLDLPISRIARACGAPPLPLRRTAPARAPCAGSGSTRASSESRCSPRRPRRACRQTRPRPRARAARSPPAQRWGGQSRGWRPVERESASRSSDSKQTQLSAPLRPSAPLCTPRCALLSVRSSLCARLRRDVLTPQPQPASLRLPLRLAKLLLLTSHASTPRVTAATLPLLRRRPASAPWGCRTAGRTSRPRGRGRRGGARARCCLQYASGARRGAGGRGAVRCLARGTALPCSCSTVPSSVPGDEGRESSLPPANHSLHTASRLPFLSTPCSAIWTERCSSRDSTKKRACPAAGKWWSEGGGS